MAKTVDEGFDVFLSWLTPTTTETTNAKNHRASIEAAIKGNFGLNRFFRTGSFGNGTSVSGFSDVDYFANIPVEKLKANSNASLEELRRALDNRFPRTGVHIDAPAVVVPFGSDPAEATEIVPAHFISRSNERSTYDIPDGKGAWRRSSPESHKTYIDHHDTRLKGKVKPLIRFLKAWKYYESVPISSFYLEMYGGVYASGENSIVYRIDMRSLFSRLKSGGLPPVEDPMGVSGYIDACKSATDKVTAIGKLDDAIRRSSKAREAEEAKNGSDAFYWWDLVFGGKFPAYY